MNRDQKSDVVSALNETFSKAKFAVVADYRGLKSDGTGEIAQESAAKRCPGTGRKEHPASFSVKGTAYEDRADSI